MPLTKLRPSYTLTEDRLRELQAILPEAFADGRINWDTLREALGERLEDETQEHFGLFWPGKREARRLAALPSKGTLVPQPGEGVDEDNTHNLFIEGDNLEVLKLLQKSYAGRVKMIYIDPPYNTGNDFIYYDDFAEPLETYLKRTNQVNEEGQLLTTNSRASGRFHSNWLNMIYPRILIARQLLRDDGVIFVSIDNNEVQNLRLLLNEVFGEECFAECLVWNKRIPKNDKYIGSIHEYVLVYVKNGDYPHKFTMPKDGLEEINALREKWIEKKTPIPQCETELRKLYAENEYERGITLYNSVAADYRIWGKINLSWPNANTFGPRYQVVHPKTKHPVNVPDRGWRWREETFQGYLDDENVIALHDGTFISNRIWFDKTEKTQPSFVKYLDEVENLLLRSVISLKSDGGIEVENLFGNKSMFSYPKPTSLLKLLINSVELFDDDIVLDFFAGSATTAQSVLELAREKEKKIKFFMVQLPEQTGNKKYPTIADFGKERIRKVLKNMQPEKKGMMNLWANEDLGFKSYQLVHSNFETWQPHEGKNTPQLQLKFDEAESPLVKGWKPENLFSEILLLQGFPLDSQVNSLNEVKTNSVQKVTTEFIAHPLYVCLDKKIKPETVDKLNLGAEDIFVCLDSALSDESKIALADGCNLQVI